MASAQRPLTANQRERRRRILEATRALITEHGYTGTIMRDVAARADVSATTLYNLYNTKDELLLAALRDSIGESARRAAQDAPRPGHHYLLAHVHHVAEFTRAQPSYVSAISQALFRASPGDALVAVLMEMLREDALKSLRCMRDNDELDAERDPEQLAALLTGAFWSTFLLWSKGLIALEELEHTLRQSYLSLLIPCARDATRRELEALYRGARPIETTGLRPRR